MYKFYLLSVTLLLCSSCHILQTTKLNDRKNNQRYVILKLDDVVPESSGPMVSDRWIRVTEFLEQKKIKSALGIIGYSLEKNHPSYFQWIKDLNEKGYVEFWNHGFYARTGEDTVGEFEKDFITQLRALFLTDSLAKAKLSITLNAWGPHWSATNEFTDKALSQIPSIKIAFGYPPETKLFQGIVLPQLINMEYPAHNPDFESFLAAYKKLGKIPFLSYLQGHPNSWDKRRWDEFVKIIEFLQSENILFITPSEYDEMINCRN